MQAKPQLSLFLKDSFSVSKETKQVTVIKASQQKHPVLLWNKLKRKKKTTNQHIGRGCFSRTDAHLFNKLPCFVCLFVLEEKLNF